MPQMLAGMTLGYLIKHEAGLDCHVTVGGPHITMLREALAQVPAIFSLFDSAVVFDGEVPLLRLVEADSETIETHFDFETQYQKLLARLKAKPRTAFVD